MTDFNSPQYKRVMAACKERDKFPTQAWIPDEEKCVHAKLHKAEVNEELSKAECFNAIVEGMKILGWDDKKENHGKYIRYFCNSYNRYSDFDSY